MPTRKRVKKKRVKKAREERFPEKIPISLLMKTDKGVAEEKGRTVDISVLGLQVETKGMLVNIDPEEGMRLTSSRAMRHAAWMIQETERSWRIASF